MSRCCCGVLEEVANRPLHLARPGVIVLVVWVLRGHVGERLDSFLRLLEALAGCV